MKERWLDSLHISAKVFSQMREDCGMEAEGIIFGFPWDVKGAILKFSEDYFFITYEDLEIAYRPDKVFRINQNNTKLVRPKLDKYPSVYLNRSRVPLYCEVMDFL